MQFEETEENTAPIGTDGLDYGNYHERKELSDLPEELCACCFWIILTPRNVSSN